MSKGYNTQQRIYNYLVDYTIENLYPPSIREICNALMIASTSTVYWHLKVLEKDGRIELKDKSPRAIKLLGYKFVKDS